MQRNIYYRQCPEYKYIQVCYPLEDGSGDDFWNEVSYSYNKDNNGWEIATQEVYMGAPQYGEDAKRSSIIEDYVVKNLMRDKNFSIKLSPSNRESAADDLVILV